MKTQYLIKFILILAVILFVVLPSCKNDEEESVGAPSLVAITTIKDQKTNISGGNMGDWIAIHGQNLESVIAINFNDVEVDMEEIYYEDNIIYLQVPVKIPLSVTNKLTVTTKGGEVSHNFTVSIPDMELTRMFNEYELPGDTILIVGKFFDLYECDSENTRVYFGEVSNPVIENGGTYLTVQVPVNVQPNVKVKAVNSKYSATAICPGYYQDKNSVVTTFDDDFPYKNTLSNWAQLTKLWSDSTMTRPRSSGNCLSFQVSPDNAPAGLGWWYLMENSFTYTRDMMVNPDNYVLKFELRMGNPISRTNFFIYYYWAVSPIAIGGNYFTVQNPNQWETVTIPFELICAKGTQDGNSVNFSLNFRVENYAPVESVNMYFDNFRIYKKGD